ncbi:MAG: hemolysin III family protein [Sorangiineae bacterium PRO1]|nr:hemolysin III family protein [Sorangiineae bacterium PRO1]
MSSEVATGKDRAEIANSVSHGLGLLAALAALPLLVTSAARRGPVAAVVGASVFSATLVLLYLCSTLYHALPGPKAKRVFRVLDHAAIFLLIAGTYTPFTLGVLSGVWGLSLLTVVWVLAIAGVVLEVVGGMRFPRLSMALYLGMGWLVLAAIRPLWQLMEPWGLFWLIAGGLAYTSGVAFYAAKRLPHAHLVWHLFVIAGSTCHTIAVLEYS